MLFDLDGTLTNPEVGIVSCIEHAAQSLGRVAPPREELRQHIGPPLHISLATLLNTDDPSLVQLALTRYRERYSTIGLLENTLYPFVSDGLAALRHAQHRLFVATSKPTVHARRILAHFDLARYFDGIHGAELTGERSDKGELIAFIMEQERLEPRTTWMIGDRSHDIIGGTSAEARAEAARLDAAPSSTARGALWGVPIVIKANTSAGRIIGRRHHGDRHEHGNVGKRHRNGQLHSHARGHERTRWRVSVARPGDYRGDRAVGLVARQHRPHRAHGDRRGDRAGSDGRHGFTGCAHVTRAGFRAHGERAKVFGMQEGDCAWTIF